MSEIWAFAIIVFCVAEYLALNSIHDRISELKQRVAALETQLRFTWRPK